MLGGVWVGMSVWWRLGLAQGVSSRGRAWLAVLAVTVVVVPMPVTKGFHV